MTRFDRRLGFMSNFIKQEQVKKQIQSDLFFSLFLFDVTHDRAETSE
jgi:hypothetical protein